MSNCVKRTCDSSLQILLLSELQWPYYCIMKAVAFGMRGRLEFLQILTWPGPKSLILSFLHSCVISPKRKCLISSTKICPYVLWKPNIIAPKMVETEGNGFFAFLLHIIENFTKHF